MTLTDIPNAVPDGEYNQITESRSAKISMSFSRGLNCGLS
jgi:hypothetical protein